MNHLAGESPAKPWQRALSWNGAPIQPCCDGAIPFAVFENAVKKVYKSLVLVGERQAPVHFG
jgi:hypothetical protein